MTSEEKNVTDNIVNPDLKEEKDEVKYFDCAICLLHERYEYYGKEPSFSKKVTLLEDSYIIEDPFLSPRQGEILVLGAHCRTCNKSVCKANSCSMFYERTYCMRCAKDNLKIFPLPLRDKINKIII